MHDTYFERVRRLGPSTLAVFVALLLVIVSLTQPFWTHRVEDLGDDEVATRAYGWGRLTVDEFISGTLDSTTIIPYTSPESFRDFRIREVANTFYLVLILFAAFLFASGISLYGLRQRPGLPLVPVLVLVAGIAIGVAALLYTVVALPAAASADLADAAIVSQWGSRQVGAVLVTWGPGIAWYFTLTAVALAAIALVLVLLQAGILKSHT